MADFQAWKDNAIGRHIDVDGWYGAQCVDVVMDWSQTLFPGHGWSELIGFGNAKDLFGAASDTYFDKIANDHNDPNQLPIQGDIIIYDQTSTNPYGHTAVVDAADSGGVNEVEQNGFNPDGAAYEVYRVWGRSPCIGWLRPKDLSPAPQPQPEPVPAEPTPVENTPTPVTPEPLPAVEPPVETQPEPVPVPVVEPQGSAADPSSETTPYTPKPSNLLLGWFHDLVTRFLDRLFKRKRGSA